MPIPHEFDYIKALSLDEALNVLDTYKKDAKVLAGGTDMANMLKQGFPVPKMMLDIKGIKELDRIELTDKGLYIGALVTFSSILKSKIIKDKFNIMWQAAHLVASNGVRNRATMIGNICSAVACMDSAAPLLVHDAVMHLQSKNGLRHLPIKQWFIDNRKTAIAENEMVVGVHIPIPSKKYAGIYKKLMRYSGEDLAQANVGVLILEDNTYRIAFGAVGPTPKRSPKIENILNGKKINDTLIEEVKNTVEQVIAPITDVRATKEYRMHMSKVLLERALREASAELEKI